MFLTNNYYPTVNKSRTNSRLAGRGSENVKVWPLPLAVTAEAGQGKVGDANVSILAVGSAAAASAGGRYTAHWATTGQQWGQLVISLHSYSSKSVVKFLSHMTL